MYKNLNLLQMYLNNFAKFYFGENVLITFK